MHDLSSATSHALVVTREKPCRYKSTNLVSVLLQSVHTVKLSKTARELDEEILVTIKRWAIISPRGLISGKQDHRKKGISRASETECLMHSSYDGVTVVMLED